MALTPIKLDDQTIDRSGFYIHGDKAGDVERTAGRGCVVLEPPACRLSIAAALPGDDILRVNT
jgi:hypothetical protein